MKEDGKCGLKDKNCAYDGYQTVVIAWGFDYEYCFKCKPGYTSVDRECVPCTDTNCSDCCDTVGTCNACDDGY